MRSSAGAAPAITCSVRARSRTLRAIGPSTERLGQPRKPGSLGTSPNVGLSPATPQNDDGIRIEPPPSVPSANGTIPAATAAAEPPLEPPGVRPRSHGLRVSPYSALSVIPR